MKNAKLKIQRYKKRSQRNCTNRSDTVVTVTQSPATTVKNLTAGKRIPVTIRKKLLFGEILSSELKLKKKRTTQSNQVIQKVVASPLLKKYKLMGYAGGLIGHRELRKFVNC